MDITAALADPQTAQAVAISLLAVAGFVVLRWVNRAWPGTASRDWHAGPTGPQAPSGADRCGPDGGPAD